MCLGVRPERREKVTLEKQAKDEVRLHCYAFQKGIVESLITDATANAKHFNSIFMPYATVRSFYGEYTYWCNQVASPLVGSETTFTRAWNELKLAKSREGIELKTSGGNGNDTKFNCVPV